MIDIKTTKTYTVANNDTVKSILSNAFKETIDAFVITVSSQKKISRKEFDKTTRLLINGYENQLDNYQKNFHNKLKNQLSNQLRLTNDEYIQFGDVKHANGIGNNCEYPIQIVTKDEIIDFGKLHSNTDIFCNIKHIRVADNDNQDLDTKRVKLCAILC